MSLVGTTVRNGLRTANGIEVEMIRVVEEFEEHGKRYYRCRVLRNHQGMNRVVLADVYDRLYTPATRMKPNMERGYKGDNPNREVRARSGLK